MQQELLIAILAGLGGMLGWGFADFFAKKTIDKVGSIVSLVWAHVFGTLALTLIILYQIFIRKEQVSFPADLNTWSLLAFFGGFQAIIYLLAYSGFGKGKLAVLNPIFASYSGLAALFSILIFKEIVPPYLVTTLLIIFSGVLLLSIDLKTILSRNFKIIGALGMKEVALASLFAAFWTIFWDRFIGGQDWVVYALLMYAFMTLVAFLIAKFQKVKLSVVKPKLWKFLILIGVCEVIAYLAISLGFSATTHTSLVAVLSGAFSLPTIILARFFLKEKVTAVQTLGSIIIIIGIVLLSLQ